MLHGGNNHNAGPQRQQAAGGGDGLVDGVHRVPGQAFQFEVIRRHDVGQGQQLAAYGLLHAVAHIDPAVVTNHRVTKIQCAGPGRAQVRHRVDGDRGCARQAEVSGEHGAAASECTDGADALQQISQFVGWQHAPLGRAVAGMVCQQHGRYRQHFEAEHLQRRHGGAVADVTIGHLARNRHHDGVLHAGRGVQSGLVTAGVDLRG